MTDWMFVDTCIWMPFSGKRHSQEHHMASNLLRLDRVALVGSIVAEVLLGIRRKDQADWVASRLRLANGIESDWGEWHSAAELGRELSACCHQIALSDLLLEVTTRGRDASLYSTDPHVDSIPDLRRYWP